MEKQTGLAIMENTVSTKQAEPLLPTLYLQACPNWQDNEISVYEATNTGLAFEKLNTKQAETFMLSVLFKVSAITSCQLPSDKRYLGALQCEMKKFMMENKKFSTITFEEIITAFRLNAAGYSWDRVEHYQNMFNLDYLGKVLSKYIIFKQKVQLKARTEEILKNLLEPEIDEENSDQKIIECARDLWEQTNDFLNIPSKAYDILQKSGIMKMSSETKDKIRYQASIKAEELYWKGAKMYYSMDDERLINKIAKKISVSEYFINNHK